MNKKMRIRCRHPFLAAGGFHIALSLAEPLFRLKHIHRSTSKLASERLSEVTATLARGEPAYLAGVSIGGSHNTGVALVELTRDGGPRVVCNNEEERFSGEKHTCKYPQRSLEALTSVMKRVGIGAGQVRAWLATFDYPLFVASRVRTMLEEFPASLLSLPGIYNPGFDRGDFREGIRAPVRLSQLFGCERPVQLIGMPHHGNHAQFSYCASPFAQDPAGPVMIAVIEGSGDFGAISLYVGEHGVVRQVRANGSQFDSVGTFYGVISSTQGGWTYLSSEGRYMGAAAYGNMNRSTNECYSQLRHIFSLNEEGQIYLNRCLANWPRYMLRRPYTAELTRILGEPISPERMWNPDAVLRVEDIHHKSNTQERLDKAAATQMVFEDAVIHIIDHLIRSTNSDRLVLTGGAALNAVANMRLLEHFDEEYYERVLRRSTRLHLWVPPVSGDAGVTIGAAYAFAAAAGVGAGASMKHAFYCGASPTASEILAALRDAPDVAWAYVGNASGCSGRDAIVDLMAFMTERDAIIALFQGPAETGPRALGHRSILANPCNPHSRDLLNERVKYREAIRPLAPMATLSAAKQFFELCEGASDDEYNAYNYMVMTVRAKPHAHLVIPAVIHVDSTARLQIVRENTDAVTYGYLKALGRRLGVEVAVNTSFNVAGPIAQFPSQAVDTLRRATAMDGVFMFSEEGSVFMAWIKEPRNGAGRVRKWLVDWQRETGAELHQSL